MIIIIFFIIIIIMKRWCSTTWRPTLGQSFPRSWRREDTQFSPYLSQGDHNGGDNDNDKGDNDGVTVMMMMMTTTTTTMTLMSILTMFHVSGLLFWFPGNYSAHRRRQRESSAPCSCRRFVFVFKYQITKTETSWVNLIPTKRSYSPHYHWFFAIERKTPWPQIIVV